MKYLFKIFCIPLTMFISSCHGDDKLCLVSGYSADTKPDVMLCTTSPDGSVRMVSEFNVGNNPSFFNFGDNNLVYFANEVDSFNLERGGGITTLRLDMQSGTFTLESSINQGAAGPCHITLTDDGRYLITANYGSGSVSVVRLSSEGIPERVSDVIYYGDKSHPHMTLYNPRKEIYYVSDLGLDRIHQFRLDTASGRLINAEVPFLRCEQGSGPRHMVIDEKSANLYVINELNSTVSVFNILSDTTSVKQTVSTLPEGYGEKNYCADIHLSSGGKVLYGSNRGHNSIVRFKVGIDGRLSSLEHRDCDGDWPRNFAVSPSGNYILVANQRSNEVSVISARGSLEGESLPGLSFNAPACMKVIE